MLCIDPETKLPFMVNMGLKTAEMCDLDNRPIPIKVKEYLKLNGIQARDNNISEFASDLDAQS